MQRKIFRVEQMFSGKHSPAAGEAELRHGQLIGELKALRALAERPGEPDDDGVEKLKRELDIIYDAINRNRHALVALHGNRSDERQMARATDHLGAAIDGMENATQKILEAAEVIDESAKALTATLKKEYERGLAQDIQDQLVQIYEACNFQDLAGQRIAQVMATLKFIEEHVVRMVGIWDGIDRFHHREVAAAKRSPGGKLVNGPRLDGDHGHASQTDIDRMFG